MSADLVTLRSGQCLSLRAIELAVELEFQGWSLQRDGERLKVTRRDDSDLGLTDEMREAIRLNKPDLLIVANAVEELARTNPDKPDSVKKTL